MIDFVTATQQRDALNAELSDATDTLKALTNELAGDAPRIMNLTPDSVKADPRWQAAKTRVDRLFQALRQFNGTYTKQFKRELAAQHRANRYA
jgi:predicted  nucleic acid-binding Zn-ribbon protein